MSVLIPICRSVEINLIATADVNGGQGWVGGLGVEIIKVKLTLVTCPL